MNQQTANMYRRFRNAGYQPAHALRAAKILLAWDKAERKGLVRLIAEEERENYFDVYGEPDGYTNIHGRKIHGYYPAGVMYLFPTMRDVTDFSKMRLGPRRHRQSHRQITHRPELSPRHPVAAGVLADGAGIEEPKRVKGKTMGRIIITIETENAAFEASPTGEIGRILRDLAERIEQDGILPELVRDINGNVVGSIQTD